jgi:hypothetical protein
MDDRTVPEWSRAGPAIRYTEAHHPGPAFLNWPVTSSLTLVPGVPEVDHAECNSEQ